MANAIALAGWSPEVLAYAIAMYSRSRLSIAESIQRITDASAGKFLESFYHGYGHRSIADSAHVALAIEGEVSEIAAFELEDQQLWDGQERSTRYQDFGVGEGLFFIPRSVRGMPLESAYVEAAEFLLGEYRFFSEQCFQHLTLKNPKPSDMKDGDYERTMKARAFDVARYWLFGGIKTAVGQVTSARSLEDQITRLMSSEYPELRELCEEIKRACSARPLCPPGRDEPPIAPTLVKYAEANQYLRDMRRFIRDASKMNDWVVAAVEKRQVDLVPVASVTDEILATMFYEGTQLPYRHILAILPHVSLQARKRLLDCGFGLRGDYDALYRSFASGYQIIFDVVIDRGAQRDLHRHRRCIQVHQPLSVWRGYDIPRLVVECGLTGRYRHGMQKIKGAVLGLTKSVGVDATYLIPFAYRSATLYKMDFAEAIYIAELRSGVGGHFSYREAACQMYDELRKQHPLLIGLHAQALRSDDRPRVTPFETEDLLKR